MLYPLTFRPIFKERVWGGRNLERLYQKQIPPGVPIGESYVPGVTGRRSPTVVLHPDGSIKRLIGV